MKTEVERLRDLLGRYARHVEEIEGTAFLDMNPPGQTTKPLTDGEREEIAEYLRAVTDTASER